MRKLNYDLKDLQSHKETFITWGKSCITTDQIKLLLDTMSYFICSRFEGTGISRFEIEKAKIDVLTVLHERKTFIESVPSEVPTLDAYIHNKN